MAGKSPGQRSLAGYSPRGDKESDRTVQVSTRTHTHTHALTVREGLRCNSEQRDHEQRSGETSSVSGSGSLWWRRRSVSKQPHRCHYSAGKSTGRVIGEDMVTASCGQEGSEI